MFIMVVGCRQLDQPLKKRFFRLGFNEPYLFPDFMRLKKLP